MALVYRADPVRACDEPDRKQHVDAERYHLDPVLDRRADRILQSCRSATIKPSLYASSHICNLTAEVLRQGRHRA